ncbi:hypothetical protein BC831DRAFT_259471 [Entophlyctis helioformis]|nr:hypothetical protein BC831DRAFT_259471 [Entophlyctis helioformis]
MPPAVQPRGTAAHSTASDASASTRNTASNRAKGTRSSAAATSKKTSVKVHSFALDNDDEDEDDEGAGEQLKDDVVDGADEGRSDDEDADEEEYEVERILDHRKRRGKTEYLVKWKDYPDSENSWAWEDDMQAPEIIAAYLKSRKQTPKRPLVESARLSNASSARLSTGSKAGKGEELRGSESDEEITVKKVPKLAAKGSTASPASSKTAKKDESNGAVSSQKRKGKRAMANVQSARCSQARKQAC